MRIQSWNYLDTVEAGGSIPSAPPLLLRFQLFTLPDYPTTLGYVFEQIGQIRGIVNSQFTDLGWFVRNERYPFPGRDHVWRAVQHALRPAFLGETEQAVARLGAAASP